MQLIIKNLGPVKEGKIDLSKRFYVFVGYNNSGKTYVSQLLWAVFNEETIEKFSRTVEIEELQINGRGSFEITQSLLDGVLDKFSIFLKEEAVPNTFNITASHQILCNLSVGFEVNTDELRDCQRKAVADIGMEGKKSELFTLSKEKDSLAVNYEEKILPEDFPGGFSKKDLHSLDKDRKSARSRALVWFLLNLVFNNTHKSFFLPSSRHIYVAFELMKKQETGEELDLELMNSFNASYTEPVNLLFNKVYKLNESTSATSHYKDFTDDLASIIGGDIVMKKNMGIVPVEFYLRMPKQEEDLEMYLSSSSVNQLSVLYLYFKYWANEANNFLLIDEPEENIHPKHQIALLNVLASFAAENNNRVLITTHSPLLADMVNNYHYMAFLKSRKVPMNSLRENYRGINPDINLPIEDMGVYFFDGDRIQTYEMGNYGVFFEDFYYEIKKTRDIGEMLTDQMYELMNGGDS